MDYSNLKKRFLDIAISVYKLTKKFPGETVYRIVENQILRSSSSSAANYRASCRGKSGLDFINKLKIVEEELDETLYWLDYTLNINSSWAEIVAPICREGNELLSITVASIKTARRHLPNNPKPLQ